MTDVTYLNNSLCFQEVGEILLFQYLDDKTQVFFYEKRVHKKLSSRCYGKQENFETAKETISFIIHGILITFFAIFESL